MVSYFLFYLSGLSSGATIVLFIALRLSKRKDVDITKAVSARNGAKLRQVRKRLEQIISRSLVYSDARIIGTKALREIDA